jgi:pilus assembly protein CpaB
MRLRPRTAPGSDAARGTDRAGVKHFLPAGLVGPGRRQTWQRTRLRRVVTAGLVVVVAQDLMPGHVLTPGDLTVADWPTDLRPAGAVADPAALLGKALGAGMSRGEPVTPARVRGPGLLTGARPGLVAAHVRLADPAMAAMTSAGDIVDLISSSGLLVAARVVVLAVDAGAAEGGGWSATSDSGPPGGVVVAVSSDEAMRLAKADPSGLSDVAFSLVVRAPSI